MTSRKTKDVLREAVRTNFAVFARRAFATATGGETLSKDPYIGVLCKTVVDVLEGRTRRLVVNLPPRHAKTLLVTICLATRELALRPSAKVMIVCHDQGLAEFISRKIRDILKAKWFKEAFPKTRIRVGHDRATDTGTTERGYVLAMSIAGGITGHGADLIIVDDLADIEDAKSPACLALGVETFKSKVRTRLNNPKAGRIVIVAHRLSPNDLSGHLLRSGRWAHICLPLIAERDQEYETDSGIWRRKQGELLRADAFSEDDLDDLRRLQTIPDFSTLYQQKPAEASWTLTEADFPTFGPMPPGAGGCVLSIDTAQVVGQRNSFSVCQAWRASGDAHFLFFQWRGQRGAMALKDKVRSLIKMLTPSIVLIEAAGGGVSLAEDLRRRESPATFLIELINPGPRSKLQRFSEFVPMIQAGAVRVPEKAEWVPELLDEILHFPDGDHDDQVDALSQYLAFAKTHPAVPLRRSRVVGVSASTTGVMRTYTAGQPDPRLSVMKGGRPNWWARDC